MSAEHHADECQPVNVSDFDTTTTVTAEVEWDPNYKRGLQP